ncbi:MAG: hypothetical protein KC910_25405, partial [Candidatus Eremiobacteraeota bacterium]|nr:hypothetical protein [Candidatus Eremiobacteraeota bacterium]
MKLLIPTLLWVLILTACSRPPSTPSETASPLAIETAEPDLGTVTIVTPTPGAYPDEPPEGSAAFTTFFDQTYLGSRKGDYVVLLSPGFDFQLIKRGNPAFSTGGTKWSELENTLKENPDFKEPLKLVLEN